ncbi:MAG: TIGR02757 family protein [Deltaproteobacteria bacterium]|uniref:TIGR02757 family protein n=1 Tax=Candidatus Zymogenus saltonus TaxID=2844893 RepID=A0A9D8PMG1_9DELT|nr:TIGR02757 family protein [Candidatus Zymogenus saltonus]
MTIKYYADIFEELYYRYNRREYVHPDPLEFLYKYEDPRDREICGLIASSLAYGRVRQILKSVSAVLEKMKPTPSKFLRDSSLESLEGAFSGFKHRFSTGEEVALTLFSVKRILDRYGYLEKLFVSGLKGCEDGGDGEGVNKNDKMTHALFAFVRELNEPFNGGPNSLIPSHEKGSSMKRLNLFLRWMVREDAVDPGGWKGVKPSQLMIPLDIHMHGISLSLGITGRKQANIKTVDEVTEAFRVISPEDPARYDFVLTRFGIRDELCPKVLIRDINSKLRSS